MSFQVTFKTKWADFDPNRHMRHTAYNDYAAEGRVCFFKEKGFDIDKMEASNIGPILFKEETSFYREISIGEDLVVEIFLRGTSANAERWKIMTHIYKQNGVLAAEVNVFGAWIDLTKRKLTVPPAMMINVFNQLEKTENFEEIILKDKSLV